MATAPPPDPVFILGNHRSGTTWLYQLLNGTGHFQPLTAYQVIEWEGLDPSLPAPAPAGPAALADRLHGLGVRARRVDGVPITPDLPEEYCYILNNHGHRSWLTDRDLPLFRRLQRVLTDADPLGRPLLLKNPWDYGNFHFLASRFPTARFIFIHRHPLRVVQSNLKTLRTLWVERDAYTTLLSHRYRRNWDSPFRVNVLRWLSNGGLGLRLVSAGVSTANRIFHNKVDSLDPTRHIQVRYEDVCEDPGLELHRILRFLDRPSASADTPARPPGPALPAELERRATRILRPMSGYLTRLGYAPTPSR